MIPLWMTKHLAKVQENYLERLAIDPGFALEESQSILHNKIFDIFPKEMTGKVLELGCGPGKYIPMLTSLGHSVIGVDPCDFPTWALIRKYCAATIQSGVRAEALPFGNDEFDYIACLGALLYFEDPDLAFKEMYRVTKPGGKILLRTVNSGNAYTKRTGNKLDPNSKNLYTMDELERLVKSHGFDVVEKWSFGYWPPILTNLWWYSICVFVPDKVQKILSDLTAPQSRVVNVIVFNKPLSN